MKIALIVPLLLALFVNAHGALQYSADNDRVEVTSNAVLDLQETGTIAIWVYLTDDTLRQNLFSRQGTVAYYDIAWRADLAGDYFVCSRQQGITDNLAQADAANFAAYGLNKWVFIVFTWNSNGANADQKILIGDLITPAAEPSSYTTQTVGSGVVSASWGTNNLFVGNSATNQTREIRGRIAWVGTWNTSLTTQQIISQQWHPRLTTGNVLFMHLGWPDTTRPDFSGNALASTLTGVTNGAHVPLNNLFGL